MCLPKYGFDGFSHNFQGLQHFNIHLADLTNIYQLLTYIYIYTYMCIYIYMYTYIYIYIHIYIYKISSHEENVSTK